MDFDEFSLNLSLTSKIGYVTLIHPRNVTISDNSMWTAFMIILKTTLGKNTPKSFTDLFLLILSNSLLRPIHPWAKFVAKN